MITCYFGVPGAGKTCFLTMLAQRELKRIKRNKSKYDFVLTNFNCDGCHLIDYNDLGNYRLDNCLILLDELVMDADNRNFKSFKPEIRDFFILHRHVNCDIIYATQSFELVDLKIRQLTAELWYMEKCTLFSFFTRCKRIYRTIAINEHTSDLTLGYRFCTLLEQFVRTNFKLCFRPRWYKFYNTHELGNLKDREYYPFSLD